MRQKSVAVIIVAAGKGERAGTPDEHIPKQYRRVAGQAVLARTVRAFIEDPGISWVLPVIHPDHGAHYSALALTGELLLPPVVGGVSRQASVLEGLKALAPLRPDLVLVHDAARPFASRALTESVIAALVEYDGALPGLAVTDTIKRSGDGVQVDASEDRRRLFAAQTPQGFRFGQFFSAHMRAANMPREFTDDAEIAEWAGLRVALVQGERDNIKITHPEDFQRAEKIAQGEHAMETRIGTGYDVHVLEPGDGVWLGGIKIPFHARLKGHSDADVALHALTDALLGAIGAGDIGVHFPPSDMQWKGTVSTVFLRHAGELVAARGGRIVNVDITIVCEAPKIGPHAPAMCAMIAETLGISVSRVSVKASTNERLGFVGREEGIVAMASASVEMPRVD